MTNERETTRVKTGPHPPPQAGSPLGDPGVGREARFRCCVCFGKQQRTLVQSNALGDIRLITLVEDESDHQVNLIFDDAAVVNPDLLFFDPGAANIAYGFGSALDPALNRVLKTLRGCRANLSNPCDRHNSSSPRLLTSMCGMQRLRLTLKTVNVNWEPVTVTVTGRK